MINQIRSVEDWKGEVESECVNVTAKLMVLKDLMNYDVQEEAAEFTEIANKYLKIDFSNEPKAREEMYQIIRSLRYISNKLTAIGKEIQKNNMKNNAKVAA